MRRRFDHRFGIGLALALPLSLAAAAARAAPAQGLPVGVSPQLYQLAVPDGPPSPERVALGEKLFREKRLSSDGTVSCATCHVPEKGFVDHLATSEGVGKQHGQRNAPTVLNAMFNQTQFWDGRAASLEDQAKLPILNPIEMGAKSPDEIVAKLNALPDYVTLFQRVFGHAPNYDDLARAIAAFERTEYSGNAPFDRYLQGDEKALTGQQLRGWALFNGKARCNECHAFNAVSPIFSDQKFHNIGVAARQSDFVQLAREAITLVRGADQEKVDHLAIESKYSNLGRFLVTRHENDVGAFKTPTLRDVGVTGPYMHDGSMATLWDVVDHYNKGGIQNPFLDGGMQRLGLSEREVDELVAFLFTLTSDRYRDYNREELARQQGLKGTRPQRDLAAALGKQGDFGDLGPNPDQKNPATEGAF